ncbi:MAG: hypothetical protein ACOX2F_07945 [bacterium]
MKNSAKLSFLLLVAVFILSCGIDDNKCSSNEECPEGFVCDIDLGECEPDASADIFFETPQKPL